MLASWWKGTAEATLKRAAAAVVKIISFIFVELEGNLGCWIREWCRVGERRVSSLGVAGTSCESFDAFANKNKGCKGY